MKLDNRKVRILRKLVEYGADTEKKIADLALMDLVQISKETSLSVPEMELISELQEAIKEKKVISYLVEREEEDGAEGEKGSRTSDSNAGGTEGFYPENAGGDSSQY